MIAKDKLSTFTIRKNSDTFDDSHQFTTVEGHFMRTTDNISTIFKIIKNRLLEFETIEVASFSLKDFYIICNT